MRRPRAADIFWYFLIGFGLLQIVLDLAGLLGQPGRTGYLVPISFITQGMYMLTYPRRPRVAIFILFVGGIIIVLNISLRLYGR
jgi:hypothetical protein